MVCFSFCFLELLWYVVRKEFFFDPSLDVLDRKFDHEGDQDAGDNASSKLLFDLSLRASDCPECNNVPIARLDHVIASRNLSNPHPCLFA